MPAGEHSERGETASGPPVGRVDGRNRAVVRLVRARSQREHLHRDAARRELADLARHEGLGQLGVALEDVEDRAGAHAGAPSPGTGGTTTGVGRI